MFPLHSYTVWVTVVLLPQSDKPCTTLATRRLITNFDLHLFFLLCLSKLPFKNMWSTLHPYNLNFFYCTALTMLCLLNLESDWSLGKVTLSFTWLSAMWWKESWNPINQSHGVLLHGYRGTEVSREQVPCSFWTKLPPTVANKSVNWLKRPAANPFTIQREEREGREGERGEFASHFTVSQRWSFRPGMSKIRPGTNLWPMVKLFLTHSHMWSASTQRSRVKIHPVPNSLDQTKELRRLLKQLPLFILLSGNKTASVGSKSVTTDSQTINLCNGASTISTY